MSANSTPTGSAAVVVTLYICLGTPFPAMAEKGGDDEEMMWRGTVSMSMTERHRYDISETTENGAFREENRNEEWRQTVSIQVKAADIFVSGDIEASGSLQARINDNNRRYNRSPRGEWSRTLTTHSGESSASLTGEHLMITVAKKQHVEAAKSIEQQLAACGADLQCLERALKRLSGQMEDKENSFPVLLVVQLFPPCRGSVESTETTESYTRRQGRKTETDGPHTLPIAVCRPMAFELEGIYTRDKKGDRITANFSDTDRPDYRAWDDENHPREIMGRCNITLSNGPPEVRIYADTSEGEKDITDEETEIMVGQKITLSAHVVSYGMGDETERLWLIPGQTFEEWYGNEVGSIYTPVSEFEEPVVEFAWQDGSTRGTRREVKYRVTYASTEMEGMTTFRVFTPAVKTQVTAGKKVGFAAPEGNCEIVPDSPSMRIESIAVMPDNSLNISRFCLAYVQLVRSNSWGLERVGYPHYQWSIDVHDWLLDSSFPYNGHHCASGSGSFAMQDTPNGPLTVLDAIYMDQEFESYLLFMPPPHPELVANRMYVPLKKVEWRWKGSAVSNKPYDKDRDQKGKCGQLHSVRCDRAPETYPHDAVDIVHHPEWEGAAGGKTVMKRWGDGPNPPTQSAPPPPPAHWSCN